MRNIYLPLLVCLFAFGSAYSQQNSWGDLPSGYNHREDVVNLQAMQLQAPSVSAINDIKTGNDPRAGEMYLIGLDIPVNLNPSNSGVWTGYNGYKTWRLKIKSIGAQALLIKYSAFNIPEGSAVYVYNSTFTHKSHAYQRQENPSGTHFSTEVIIQDEIILEYNAPIGVEEMPQIDIEGVGYIFREGHTFEPRNFQDNGSSESCEVNVNCSEGANWQDQKRGVAKMLMPSGGGYGLCTGSLVNNTNQTCRNFFLTAQHCGAGSNAASMNQWQFYFNFESATCADLNSSQANAVDNQVVTGCTKRAASGTSTGVTQSDFLLVELNSTIPSGYNVYYNGWDRTSNAATSGVGIHHPAGDIKKISTFTSALVTGSWSGGNTNKHWQVTWAGTTNGHGVTEGGSSGSPIFNQTKRIVGDLSGGSSFCDATSDPDLYGKFVHSWDQVGANDSQRLKPWLDSTNSAVTVLDGRNACNLVVVAPVANFTGTPTTLTAGNNVTFTETCTNNPTTFAWSITPNSGFTYVSSTSASSADPVIQFNTPGQYTITLTASNTAGSDAETKTNYITVNAMPAPVTNFTANLTSIAPGTNVNFTQTCTNNPTTFAWTVSPNSGFSYQSGTSASSANPVIQFTTIGQYTITLTASNAGGSDAETKTNYITVFDNTSINDVDLSSSIKIYPNPAIDVVNINIEQQTVHPISIKLIDMLGKTITTIQKPAGTEQIQIPMDMLAKGVYQIEIGCGTFHYVRKVIKN